MPRVRGLGRRITRDVVDRVRDAADIVRVVGDYVVLKANGARLKGLCPFHREKTPSFSVDPDRKLFYCFGCQTGGDLFKFVSLMESVPFPEAVVAVAERFGVPLPSDAPPTAEEIVRERALEMHRIAAARYSEWLAGEPGGACREYLERRGLSRETIARLGLGYAPDSWDALLEHLRSRNFAPEEIVRAGLAVDRRERPGQYDRFRHRLIFPIRDVSGRVIAFGGRALGDGEPKYLNSPESPTYVKGEHLYGLDLAKDAIRREGYAIVVEGYMDLAALVQGGFENVVATLGTAFTPAQVRVLGRYAPRVHVSYDGDAAGSAATLRSLDVLLEHGLDVRVVGLPDGLDPDEFLGREGVEAYTRLARGAPSYLDYALQGAIRSHDLARPEGKVAVVNAMLPHVGRLTSAVERVAWARTVADAVGLDDRVVLDEVREAFRTARPELPRRTGGPAPAAFPQRERILVRLLIEDAGTRERLLEELAADDLEPGSSAIAIVAAVRRLHGEGVAVDYRTTLEVLDADADRDALNRLAFHEEPFDAATALEHALRDVRARRLRREMKRLDTEIRTAGDVSVVDTLMARRTEIAREIATL